MDFPVAGVPPPSFARAIRHSQEAWQSRSTDSAAPLDRGFRCAARSRDSALTQLGKTGFPALVRSAQSLCSRYKPLGRLGGITHDILDRVMVSAIELDRMLLNHGRHFGFMAAAIKTHVRHDFVGDIGNGHSTGRASEWNLHPEGFF